MSEEQALVEAAPVEVAAPVINIREFDLTEPLVIDGKVFKTLDIDIRKLKGRDYKSLEEEYRKRYPKDANILAPSMDLRFREMIVGRLNKFIPDNLEDLNLEDYVGLTQRVFDFLGSRV